MANEHLPVDPNVKVPGKVAAAAAAADAIHKQAYNTPDPTPQPDPAKVAPPAQPDPAAAPVTGTVTAPATPAAPVPDEGQPGSWEHRYHSMKGRFDQSQVMIGQMQEQMSQLGDELVRSQRAFQEREAPRQQPPQGQEGLPAHIRLTNEDMQTYGPELIGLIQRAALDAVTPELGKTVSAVKQVSQRVQHTANLSLYQVLDRDIPDWRTVNVDPAFKVWCGLPDVYSGVLRGNLLRNAFQAADAPRVVAFFKGYKAEQQATGQLPVPVQSQQQAAPAPREAAVALDSLVAPGRAKPAPGEGAASAADKPIFTRDMIKNFYRNVQNGYYAGREQDKARDEAMIFAAQREGRVKG